jgi:hypothetical protein
MPTVEKLEFEDEEEDIAEINRGPEPEQDPGDAMLDHIDEQANYDDEPTKRKS